MSLDPIDIPPEARKPKPWWSRPLSDEEIRQVVQDVKAHVTATGLPHTWRGHTHTKPTAGVTPVYLGEFDIPEVFVVEGPCPCCSPDHPKYRWGGKIAHFVEEGVIRLIGPDCYASLNREGHEEAEHAFRERQRRERDIRYLLGNLPIVPEAVRVVTAALPVALAVDHFRHALQARLRLLKTDLWQQVRDDGQLLLNIERTQISTGRDGQQRTTTINDTRVYARLEGYRMLDPTLKAFEPRLSRILNNLESINYADPQATLGKMTDAERNDVANKLGRSMRGAQRGLDELADVRRFIGPVAEPTLRRWAEQDGCPVHLHFKRDGSSFYVGSRLGENLRVPIQPEIEETLNSLPQLGETRT